ncbi:galactose-6-phosphate isomerase [Streptococcus pneumoniae]|nr:galactose-6-phosphate isomerase [Streptococcus pneumoniae]
MSQSIVPVEIPQYCRFDSKKRNGILFNVRIANLIPYTSNERSSI